MLELLRQVSEAMILGTGECLLCHGATHTADCALDAAIRALAVPEQSPGDTRTAHDLRCSFCGKARQDTIVLLAAPLAYICAECVDRGAAIVAERRRESAPTDPAELAAWLYARVVPGRTVVEWWIDPEARPRKAVVSDVEAGDASVKVTTSTYVGLALLVPGPRAVRLLNPDNTVLWEAP